MKNLEEYGAVADSDISPQEALEMVSDPGFSPPQQDLAYHRLMYLASLEAGESGVTAWRNLARLMVGNATTIRETVFCAFLVRCPDGHTCTAFVEGLFESLRKQFEEYPFRRLTSPAGYWMRILVRSAGVLEKDIREEVIEWVDRFPDMDKALERFLVHYVSHGTVLPKEVERS